MIWTRSETLALALPSCTHCRGLGLRNGKEESTQPCNCALRAIFRACFNLFREINTQQARPSQIQLEISSAGSGQGSYGRKDEEYSADFCLVSRRALSEADHRIFKFHFLLGADWRACCAKLGIERGQFFHDVYRIQQQLGRRFRELQPYGLFPTGAYFHGGKNMVIKPADHVDVGRAIPLRPPLGSFTTAGTPRFKPPAQQTA